MYGQELDKSSRVSPDLPQTLLLSRNSSYIPWKAWSGFSEKVYYYSQVFDGLILISRDEDSARGMGGVDYNIIY